MANGFEWYQMIDIVATATESCEKVEKSCVSCPPQLVKVIKLSTASKSADNLKVVGNISESKLLVCWQDTNQSPNPPHHDDVTLASEDANSKLAEVVTVADVDA